MSQISPSILSADFGNLRSEVEMINRSEAEWIHVDVMDGVFVPNISFGFPVIEQVAKVATKPLDVHLMIVDPQRYVAQVKACGAALMNVHYEACTHLHRTLEAIKEAGMQTGVTLNPHTPVALLEDVIGMVDLALIMGVNPGFGGQHFIPNTVQKVIQLKEMIARKGAHALIEVDGGIDYETGQLVVDAGADVLVSGSFIFGSPNPTETIANLRTINPKR